MIWEDGSACAVEDYPVSKCLHTGKPQPAATIGVRRLDGEIVWAIFTAVPMFDPQNGKITGAVLTFLDITERKRAEMALRTHSRVLEHMVEGVNVSEAHGDILYTNPAFDAMFGYDPGELIGRNVTLLNALSPEQNASVLAEVMQQLRSQGHWIGEFKNRKKDGSIFITSARISALKLSGKDYWISVQQDITGRKQAEEERERLFEEVQQGRDRLQQLSRQLVAVQEAERRRIALELHDQVGQELTALKLNLQRVENLPAEAAHQSLKEAEMRTNQLLALIRELSLELRPTMLDDLGLLPTLLWYFDAYQARSGMRVNFKYGGLAGRRFPAEIETAAYRLVQEALTNVVRHAQTPEVAVRLWASPDRLSVQIEDRGVGFDVERALAARTSSGLSGMRERAALLGGDFTIDSMPGSGTHLTAELPLGDDTEKSG
jgi:PAS domain S-box-containing protein